MSTAQRRAAYVAGWMAARTYYGTTDDHGRHGAECLTRHGYRCTCDPDRQRQEARECARGRFPDPPECELPDGRHVPDDLPDPGDRCRYCGQRIVWTGPTPYDWELAARAGAGMWPCRKRRRSSTRDGQRR